MRIISNSFVQSAALKIFVGVTENILHKLRGTQSVRNLHTMNFVNRLVSGNLWIIKCLALAFLFGLIFSYPLSIVTDRNIELPPAYQLKSAQPLADTSKLTVPEHEGERIHGAQLTPRITGSILLWLSNGASFHPYLPASFFGLIFLASGILAAERITKNRVAGLCMGLLFAGLYTSNACFAVNWMPKPFDGVAIGLLGLSVMFRNNPWGLFLSCFAAFWTDERALVGILYLAVLFFSWPCGKNENCVRPLFIMGGAVAAYFTSRLLVGMALGWQFSGLNLLSPPFKLSVSFTQLAAWTAFEGGWLIIVSAILLLAKVRAHARLSVLLCALLLAIASSLIVLDASRVVAFSFPLILAALANLQKFKLPPTQINNLLLLSTFITLLSPNFEIIIGVAVKWLPSMFVHLLHSL